MQHKDLRRRHKNLTSQHYSLTSDDTIQNGKSSNSNIDRHFDMY